MEEKAKLKRTKSKRRFTWDLLEALKNAQDKEVILETPSPSQSSLPSNTGNSRSKDNGSTTNDSRKVSEISRHANGVLDELNSILTSNEVELLDDDGHVTRIRAPTKRRKSVLIQDWEDKIRQQQQQVNKK